MHFQGFCKIGQCNCLKMRLLYNAFRCTCLQRQCTCFQFYIFAFKNKPLYSFLHARLETRILMVRAGLFESPYRALIGVLPLPYCLSRIASPVLPLPYCLSRIASPLLPLQYCPSGIASPLLPLPYCRSGIAALVLPLPYCRSGIASPVLPLPLSLLLRRTGLSVVFIAH